MTLKDLLEKLESDMEVIIRGVNVHDNTSFQLYRGIAEDVPYSVASEPIGFSECIELEDGLLFITVGMPKKRRSVRTLQSWMDEMDEEDVLKTLLCLLYHYDVGTIYEEEENFPEEAWRKVREEALRFFGDRLGHIYKEKAVRDWFRKPVSLGKKTENNG